MDVDVEADVGGEEAAIRLELACRCCLREDGAPMRPLFDGQRAMLASTALIEISDNDGLPCQMCFRCTEQLSSAFTFKTMVERSNETLRRYVSNMKTECGSLPNHNTSSVKEEEEANHYPSTVKSKTVINTDIDSDTPLIKIEEEHNDSQSVSQKRLRSSVRIDRTAENDKCTQTNITDHLGKVHNCGECSKKFTSMIGVVNHMKCRHSMTDVNACMKCDIIYTKLDAYREHSASVHGKEAHNVAKFATSSHCCLICKEAFSHSSYLKRHNFLIHGSSKKTQNCDKSKPSYKKLMSFVKHKEKCSKTSSNCVECQDLFSNAIDVELHKKTVSTMKNGLNSVSHNDATENIGSHSVLCSDVEYESAVLDIKQEPLDELLEQASREQISHDDSNNSIDECDNDDLNSVSDYKAESDESEVKNVKKPRKKLGRPPKKKFKAKINSAALNYRCSICPKRVTTSLGLKIHMAKHYSDRQVVCKCEECGESFAKLGELKKHESVVHAVTAPQNKYTCATCNKSFKKQYHLIRHMWQHADNKEYQCEECSKSFMKVDQLIRHKLAIHSGKKKNPKTAFCSICKRGFTTEKYLETHMRMHTGDKTFTCNVCDKSFNTKWHLKEHSKWHSAEKPFLCSECGQRFIRNDYLVTHMRRHNGEKPYKCKFCNKGFPRATDLTVHERYHTGEKTHLCTVCGKGFQRQYNLTVHLRVHTGEKPYICSYCGKRFAQGNDLKSHVRRHTGERFNCELCGEGFIQGYHLTQHKRSIHGIQCTSHIRRVEKHPQLNSDIAKQEQSSADNILQLTNENSNGSEVTTADRETKDKCNDDSNFNGSAVSQLQSAPAPTEMDLSQRTHHPLKPLLSVAIFPTMHSRT